MSEALSPVSREGKESQEEERRRRTRYLIVGGAASLLLPLLGIAYIKLSEPTSVAPSGVRIFAKHGEEPPVLMPAVKRSWPAPSSMLKPAASASPSDGGSMAFIRGGSDYSPPEKAVAAAPEQKAPPPAPAPPKETKAPPVTAALQPAKPASPPAVMPKLKPGSGFMSFASQKGTAAQGQGGAGTPPAGMPDMSLRPTFAAFARTSR